MAISDITVSVSPYLQPNIGLDPSRVCLIIKSADTPVPAFLVNRNAYQEQVTTAVSKTADRDATVSACQSFFAETSGKSYAVIAVITESDMSPLDIADESLQFGFAVLAGNRTDFKKFSDLLTKVASRGSFLACNDTSSPVPSDSGQARLIQFVHNTPMALPAISFLARQLEVDPGFNCASNITNSTLTDDNFSEGLRNQLLSAGCNLYFTVDGLRKIKNGVVNDKTKIEQKYFSQNYLNYYIRTNVAEWKANNSIKQNSLPVITSFVESLFNSLTNRNLLKESESLGGASYIIDNINFSKVDGLIQANISVRYSFNGNIDLFNFSIREVA